MTGENKDKKVRDREITDILLDDFDKFEHFAMAHWKQIIGVCVGIVAVVAVVATVYSIGMSREKRVNEEIAAASTPEELRRVIKDFSREPAVLGAYSRLAEYYVGNKDFANAIKVYEELASRQLPQQMKWQIDMDMAYLQELSGDKKAAVADFARIASNAMFPEAMRCEANYSAGRLEHALNNDKQALVYLHQASAVKAPGNPAVEFWQKLANSMTQRINAPAATDKSEAKSKAALPETGKK